jgi:hypothetical protein
MAQAPARSTPESTSTAAVAGAPVGEQAPSPAVAAAEATARDAAAQITARGGAWWGQLDPTGKRPTIIVAIALVALVLGSQFLNALVPVSAGSGGGGAGSQRPPAGAPVDIGNGIRVTPPAAWEPVATPMGLPGVRFQRGACTTEVGIAGFDASPKDLLVAYVNQVLAPGTQNVNVSAAATGVGGNGRPIARATYTGASKDLGTAVEGEITTQVTPGGIGIIVNAYAPQGQLAGCLGEVHQFVDTIEVRQ